MVVEEPVVEDVIGEDGEKIVVEKEKISTSGPRSFLFESGGREISNSLK